MKSEIVTVRRITLLKADVDDAIKTYIEAHYYDLQRSLQENCKGILDITSIRSIVY